MAAVCCGPGIWNTKRHIFSTGRNRKCVGATGRSKSQAERRRDRNARRGYSRSESHRSSRCEGRPGGMPCRGSRNGEGQCRSKGSSNNQWPDPAERPDCTGRQPCCRQLAQGRGCHHRAHQHTGLLSALVHKEQSAWHNKKPARSWPDAGRIFRGRGGSRSLRDRRPGAWDGYRRINTLSRLCLWHSWPAPDSRTGSSRELHRPRSSYWRTIDGCIWPNSAHNQRFRAWL